VCLRPAGSGVCAEHGPWEPHQLLTRNDRRRAAAAVIRQPFEPLVQACPRCLGEVALGRIGFHCVEHGHARDSHGPYRVDELLGPTAQREAALHRSRLARRTRARRDAQVIEVPSLPWPDAARTARLVAGAAVMAATLAFLARPAGRLDRDSDPVARPRRLRQLELDRAAALEDTRRKGNAAADHPRLVGLSGRGGPQVGEERGVPVLLSDHVSDPGQHDRRAVREVAAVRAHVVSKRDVPGHHRGERDRHHRHGHEREPRPPARVRARPRPPDGRLGSGRRFGGGFGGGHDGLGDREHPAPQLRRRGNLRHAVGERCRDGLGLAEPAAAAIAFGQVHDDALLVLRGERAQGVARNQLVDVFHSSSGRMPSAASASRSAFIAANVRLFTVPMGTASRSASSDWVYPAK
jgi:hypothetical protein